MSEEKQICNIGDKFYRIFKDKVIPITIFKVEKMKLGHYVYQDDFKPYSTSAFKSNFCNRYFKDKKLAQKVVEIRTKISALRNELDMENYNLKMLIEENEKQILEE